MEGMLTWEDIEFRIINWCKAEITHLVLAKHDVFVFSLPLLLSLPLSALSMTLKFDLEVANPALVV